MTDSHEFTFFEALTDGFDVPSDGILSRTILDTPSVKFVLFHFAAGQGLSDHTSAYPAIIQIVSGEAELKLGEETREASAGSVAYMSARLNHAVHAKTPLVMLLQMLKA